MSETILITGGCGFVGCNLAERLLRRGFKVRILDNLSRPGSEINRVWLNSASNMDRIEFIHRDVRDFNAVREAVAGVGSVFHFAAQVAVTTSVSNPRRDLEVNALGTFNVLEAARRAISPPLVVFTSTNKVYGEMVDEDVTELPTRYDYADGRPGISEAQPLDFHSPYGCSKGSADQYVRDYARIYGLPTVVLRMSCIYGPHQFGNEDQGWIAHFLLSALSRKPITIYGDGKQVRDVLYVDDLVDLFESILADKAHAKGQVFNVGGGRNNSISIWSEFGPLVDRLVGQDSIVCHGPWRPGDQQVYVSDTGLARQQLGWCPKFGVEDGVGRLIEWLGGQQAEIGRQVNRLRADQTVG